MPESIRLTCDVRTLPHQDDEYVRQQLDEVLADVPGRFLRNRLHGEAQLFCHSSRPSPDSIRRVTGQALQRDNIQWVPAISNGFTDSRFTRPLGTVTYGFSGSHPRRRTRC